MDKSLLKLKKSIKKLFHQLEQTFEKYGGGRGIRTPAGFDTPVGFQDRSLQPGLGIPPHLYDVLVRTIFNISAI